MALPRTDQRRHPHVRAALHRGAGDHARPRRRRVVLAVPRHRPRRGRVSGHHDPRAGTVRHGDRRHTRRRRHRATGVGPRPPAGRRRCRTVVGRTAGHRRAGRTIRRSPGGRAGRRLLGRRDQRTSTVDPRRRGRRRHRRHVGGRSGPVLRRPAVTVHPGTGPAGRVARSGRRGRYLAALRAGAGSRSARR